MLLGCFDCSCVERWDLHMRAGNVTTEVHVQCGDQAISAFNIEDHLALKRNTILLLFKIADVKHDS